MITTVTRIFPISALSEDTSYLLKPSELGKPIHVHKCNYVDPRTGAEYMLETTFCLAKTDNLENLKIPGLIPLTSFDCALSYGEKNIGKEFALSLPRHIPLHKIPFQLQQAVEQPTIKLHLNLKEIREAKQKKRERDRLVQPLLKYFVDHECLICGFVLNENRKHKITKHMLTHSTYSCQSCEEECFPSADALYRHSINHHSENKQYICDMCGFKSNRNYFLSLHYKKKHRFVKKNILTCFVCTFCKIKLSSWKSVLDHKKAHFGKESYMCLFCNKTFVTSSLLRYHTHVRLILKCHQCRSCRKFFPSALGLRQHEKVHASRHQFVCKICGKIFYFKCNLSEHVQLLHI